MDTKNQVVLSNDLPDQPRRLDESDLRTLMLTDPRIQKSQPGVLADGVYRMEVPYGDAYEIRTIAISSGTLVEIKL